MREGRRLSLFYQFIISYRVIDNSPLSITPENYHFYSHLIIAMIITWSLIIPECLLDIDVPHYDNDVKYY